MLELLSLLESPEVLEKLLIVVLSVASALVGIWVAKIKSTLKNPKAVLPKPFGPDTSQQFLEKAFQELQMTTKILREENKTLMEYNARLGRVIDDYRALYKDQVDISTGMSLNSQEHVDEIEELNNKIDYLINTIHDIVCYDDCDIDID